MKVVFFTLYDESARGCRYVASAAQAAGHEIAFIHFKRFDSQTIPRTNTTELEWALAQSPYQVREITAEGERFHPYPSAATETERRLIAELIDQLKPDIFGLTFTTHAFQRAVELTELIRATRPGVPIVWGGIHAIIDPETCIEHADVVCPGEGEEAFVEYLADPKRTDIAGLWFKTPTGVVKNPLRPLIQDLDALAWPTYGADEYQVGYDRVERAMAENPAYICCQFYLETTRGCPFACTYCIHSVCRERYAGQKYVRMRSLESVIEEIRQFRNRFGLQAILPFFDEILLVNKRRFARFAELYRREIGHPFCGFAHHRTTDREMLEIARDAGIAETSVGVQTGSGWIAREIYNRPIDRAAIVQLTRDIHEIGAGRLILNILCDCVFEQEEDLRATFDLLLEIPRPFLLQLSRLVPFPKSPLTQMKCDLPPLAQHVREFWHLLYLLTQSDRLDDETLVGLSRDPYLREKPEILDSLVFWILHEADPQKQPPAAAQKLAESGRRHRDGTFRGIYRKIRKRFSALIG